MVREALVRAEADGASETEGVAKPSLAESVGEPPACEEARGDGNPDWPQPIMVIHINASPTPTARLPFNYAQSYLIRVNNDVDPERLQC